MPASLSVRKSLASAMQGGREVVAVGSKLALRCLYPFHYVSSLVLMFLISSVIQNEQANVFTHRFIPVDVFLDVYIVFKDT
ncbi:uncharacterized protein BO88DRAFT_77402 [Aspergillus vadensis CBS 113365]|uniref:Uncharacterized protein n=1 Tax=Aspergillus vadensis (strain CBS 113365 / IMI 142717 / IBT 24658) TaxID=1448311 RepID=A0A319B608_ASPVC|nr:hypothetical protein BO88DRAFT_77402 [Aspergillus vadensis CBS 113365]PYH67759.1 hypothetical protein BO88DRAFT_77402 [Aspergillus vadensis CBS 113365]